MDVNLNEIHENVEPDRSNYSLSQKLISVSEKNPRKKPHLISLGNKPHLTIKEGHGHTLAATLDLI